MAVEPDGRVLLVAGGTGSIGRAVATQALANGWRVALHGRSRASVDATVAMLSAAGGGACGVVADVGEPSAAARLLATTGEWGGRIDAVVDCVSAGPAARLTGAFGQTEPEAYGAFLDLSLGHLQRLAHASLPWLARRGGTIVAFASDAARFAAPRQAIVGASRAGIVGFVRNLAMETASDGVRVNCVCPSFVEESRSAIRLEGVAAERIDRARTRAGLGLPTPEDIAPLVMFLCGDAARRITGQIVSVNGGLNC